MKLFEQVKKTFSALNIRQQAAVGVLVLSVPLAVALGVSALSSSINTSTIPNSSSTSENTSIISAIQSMSEEKSSSSKFNSSSALDTTPKGPIAVSMKPSSIEEDLEVQLVNAKGELVTSAVFKLTVKSKDGKYNKVWSVDDGFLKLTKIDGGEYTVTIEDVKGYQIPVKSVEVTVKAKIKYEKIDVSDKVKDESQVDVSKEEAKKPEAAPAPTPTLPSYPAGNATVKKDEIVTSFKYKIEISKGDFKEENVGYILNSDGNKSQYIAEVDKNGYLVGSIKTMKAGTQSLSVGYNSSKTITRNMAINAVYNAPYNLMNLTDTDNVEEETSTDSTSTSTDSTSTSTDSTSTSTDSTSTSTDSASTSTDSTVPPVVTPSPSISPSPTPPTKPSIADVTVDAPSQIVTEVVNGQTVTKINPEILKGLKVTSEKDKSVVLETFVSGWSTDGKSYYDSKGNKIKGQVNIGGSVFNFDSNGNLVKGTTKGIDISKYQRNIDWNAVKASGVEFVIIRAGYRGYGSGVLVEDPLFKSHIQGATSVGLKVGVYFFTQAITTEEAVQEASMVLELVKGYNITYPIFFDTEYVGDGARADVMSSFHRTILARVFCETIRNSGYKAGVYASKSWFYNQLLYEDLPKYEIWLAHYTSATDFRHRYDMWQFTSTASVPGIAGGVDMNWSYKAY